MKTRRQIRIAAATLILFIFLCPQAHLEKAAAQKPNARASSSQLSKKDPFKVDSKYHFDAWTTDTGLPQNSVSCILQTRDGFLWMTTNDGLVRYDGVRFANFSAGNRKDLKSSRFAQLFEDRDGNLWITTEDSKLIRYKDDLFTTYTTADGLPDTRVFGIRNDEQGTLLVETPHGFAWWKDGRFVLQDPSPNRPFSGLGFPVQSGAVWHFDQRGLHRVENGQVTSNVPMAGMTFRDIKTLHEGRSGALWVGLTNVILMRVKDGKTTSYSKKDGLVGSRVNCILEDRQGNTWIGLNGGLVRFTDGKFTQYTAADGLTSENITWICEDREGIIWIGGLGGLNRLRDNIITPYSVENGLAGNNIYPMCQDRDGTIWIGSWPGLTRYKDGVFTSFGEQFDVAGALVTSLMIDRDGALWIGSFGGGVKRVKDGRSESFGEKEGLPGGVVRAICQDRKGDIWFGSRSGLSRYKDGAFLAYTTKDGLPSNAVTLIFEDSHENLWIGTQTGLCRYKDGVFNTYPQVENLSSYMVRAVHEDGEGVIWIGTYDGGLTRLKNEQFTSFTLREGLFNNGVFQILEDARANFWISCNLGIYRVSKKELDDFADGRVKAITSIPYGKRDGMSNSECNGGGQPAGIKALDGKLWFPTQGGVAVVDPERVPVNTQPPAVIIEDFLLDNQPVSFLGAVETSPGIENFEIHYTALSFIMPERIRFKYRLEGLDTDWVDAGTRRVAYYSHVPPGHYTFRVIAANRDGVWNMEGATVQVRIIPPFWRTWWFLSLALASVAALGLLVYRRRIMRLEKARHAQQAFSQQLINSQESERQRIAAELHDGLGQHLIIIKNSALMALNNLDQQERSKEQLGDISETASLAIDEVREISYNLRPYQLDDLGLTKAIEFILNKVAASSEIRFTSDLDSIDGLFSPDAEINIYRIVQESLNNIVKHSGATTASIVIERTAHNVGIIIHDNGHGFDGENPNGSARRGGFGLKGLAERARMLDGHFEIQSAAGQGTTVALNLEAKNGKR